MSGLVLDRLEVRAKDTLIVAMDAVVKPGEVLTIMGPSGSGKSTALAAIIGTLGPDFRVSGRLVLDGCDVTALPTRARGIGLLFQDDVLFPHLSVGGNLAFALPATGRGRQVRRAAIEAALAKAGLAGFADRDPGTLSGGERARVALMRTLRSETSAAIVLITHDLGVVAEMADRVVVMYAGQVVEEAPVEALFAMPQHPYTVGLMGAIPSLGAPRARLAAIEGMVPAATAMPEGCRFASRCPFADAQCRTQAPPLRSIGEGHASRCWKAPLETLAASLPPLEPALQP